jgi:iron complex outermembrane receptor protein
VITARQIQESGVTTVTGLLQGQVPGVVAIDYGVGAEQTNNGVPISVRGDATLGYEYNNRIKVYIDGVEMSDPGQINSVDPSMIERIEILRGPQASTIYGSGAISGVMQIFMKKGENSGLHPHVQLQLAGGTVENNLNSNFTPTQDHQLNISGNDGRFSYNVGGSYKYTGEFVKNFSLDNRSVFGGLALHQGPLSANSIVRFNRRTAGVGLVPTTVQAELDGLLRFSIYDQARPAQKIITNQKTFGLDVTYAPYTVWQNTLRIGRDESDAGFESDGQRFFTPADSLLSINQNPSALTQFAYNTTLKVPMPERMQLTVTAGYDHWQSTYTSVFAQATELTGSLSGGFVSVSRSLSRNDGYFVQGILGVLDQLFLTLGIRAEENPNFGSDVHFAYAPRYGIAYTRDLGSLTMKLRAAYGASTQPPSEDAKRMIIYNSTNVQLANPDVGPQNQKGTDGGIELYLGKRASLNVTYYNQYVTDVLRKVTIGVDTGVTFSQYINVGDVHNTGAELEGMVNAGPFTVSATYTIVNSFVGRLIPEAAGLGLTAGQRLTGIAPHTGALTVGYSRGRTRANVMVTYVSVTPSQGERGYTLARFNRLSPNTSAQYSDFIEARPAQTRANISVTQVVARSLELFVRGDNVGNKNNNASEFPIYPST